MPCVKIVKIKTLDDAIASEDSEEFLMRNLKITLAYDGTEFSGWQVQPGLETIQGTLASAIGRLTGEKVLPQGSGRTDAGVHALAHVASFATESSIPVENWQKALNDVLPAAIRVLGVTEAAAEFHARKSAREKTYRYRMYRGAVCPPSWRGMSGTIRFRSMRARWRKRRVSWPGSMISLCLRRWIVRKA